MADINSSFLGGNQYDIYNNESDYFMYEALIAQSDNDAWNKIEQCLYSMQGCLIGCEH